MSQYRCPWCGVELSLVNNNFYCPNHGFIGQKKEDIDDFREL